MSQRIFAEAIIEIKEHMKLSPASRNLPQSVEKQIDLSLAD
ncbi:MAG: hypothetical protein VKO65_01520 [Cyanobacteriota bacterium]|nr:hypothetical protein [Cyanobacteriota bacterium]